MGVVVGLLLGAGACLLLWAWTSEPPARATRPRRSEVADLLVQAGVPGMTPAGLVGACVASGVLTGLAALALTGSPAIASSFALIVGGTPVGYVRSRARRRRAALRTVWPEVVDHLGSGVRAGLSLPESLARLAERGPVELRPAFAAFAEDHRVTGRFGDSLDALKDRLADPVADRIIEALRLTREVGGSDLGRLLRTLSAFLREDLRTRGELEARQSWTVNGARLAVAAPWLVLALLATRPETAAAYDTPTGVVVLASGGLAGLLAYRLMVRLGRLPEDERVLR